jgi:hypothetical protein
MKQAFAADMVDEMIPGTWAAVQVELGLKRKEDFTEEELQHEVPFDIQEIKIYWRSLKRNLVNQRGLAQLCRQKVKRVRRKRRSEFLSNSAGDWRSLLLLLIFLLWDMIHHFMQIAQTISTSRVIPVWRSRLARAWPMPVAGVKIPPRCKPPGNSSVFKAKPRADSQRNFTVAQFPGSPLS